MSKYAPLWRWIAGQGCDSIELSFAEIEQIVGLPLDHAFLNSKKELLDLGWQVEKVSLKRETIAFRRL